MIIANNTESGPPGDPAWNDARLCSAAVVRVARAGDEWSAAVSSAGHPLPLLRRADGSVESVGRPGLLLGVADDAQYADSVVRLEQGSVLVLYTDGVSDRRAKDDMFGSEGIAEVLSTTAGTASQVTDAILAASLLREAPHADDMIVLTIRVDRRCGCADDERTGSRGSATSLV